MAYDPIESSVDEGSPVNLFEFRYGDDPDDVFRYCTNDREIVAAGRIWTPCNITHGPIVSSGSLDKAPMDVIMPNDLPLGKQFIITPPSRQILLNIWRGHALPNGFDDFVRIWTGRVLAPTWREAELELSCEPVATSLKRIGLRRYYQYGCPHDLYGRICRVDKPTYTAIGAVIKLVNARSVHVGFTTTPVPFDHTRFIGGTFRYDPNSGQKALRTIVGISPDTGGYRIELMAAISGIQVGTPITMSYGCKHNWENCLLFNNTPNYGGFPNIPTKNPYRTNTF
jgi:hypothetical protein